MIISAISKDIELLAIVFSKYITDESLLCIFIGKGTESYAEPHLFIATMKTDSDGFRVIDAYTAQLFEEFLKGYELPVFSTDYISAWIDEIGERTYEITILDTASPKQTEPERYTFRLPKAYFGVCPF